MTAALFDISGKIAVVTGAGRGLGRGYVKELAQAGAVVICIGRHEESLRTAVQEMTAEGNTVAYFAGDVTDVNFIEEVMSKIYSAYGAIDILVNNAGTEIAKPIEMVVESDFDKIVSVNIKGTYMMAKEAVKYMRRSKSGKIINIASLGSFIGLAESTVYCASKGAVVQFTKALALETAKDGISVNAIAPGYFLTEMTEEFFKDREHSAWICERIPMGRIGTYKDIAGTLIFLASKASDYITGQTVTVDGGWLAG